MWQWSGGGGATNGIGGFNGDLDQIDGARHPSGVSRARTLAGDQRLEQDARVLALDLGEPPLVAEQGEQGAVVTAGQHLHRALPGQRAGAVGVDAPGHRVVEVVEVGPGAELVLEPVQHHVELQRPDGSQHRGLVAAQVRGEHLDDALGVELLDATAELLGLARLLAAHHGEVLGREARDGRELHRDARRRTGCRRGAARSR